MPALAGPLLEQLRRDVDAAIAARAAAADAEATRVRDAAAAQRAHRRAAALDAREREIGLARQAARDAATQATVGDVLAARAAFLDRVFVVANSCLEAMVAAPDFAARLEPILAEALPFVAGNDTRARCAPVAEAAVRAALAGAGRGDAEVIPDGTVAAGAILENADGAMRVDATLAARLRRLRPELSIEAVRLAEEARP